MSDSTILLIGGIVAIVFGAVAEVESKGRSWPGWGLIALAFAIVWTAWPGR